MKNFLSAVLVLAMLVVPMGVVSCFADGGKDRGEQNPMDIVYVRAGRSKLERLITVASIDCKGNLEARIGFDNFDGQYFDMQTLGERSVIYDEARGILHGLMIVQEIRRLGCERATALIIYGGGPVFVNFFDKNGNIVRTCMY